jgi:hypothetical protein
MPDKVTRESGTVGYQPPSFFPLIYPSYHHPGRPITNAVFGLQPSIIHIVTYVKLALAMIKKERGGRANSVLKYLPHTFWSYHWHSVIIIIPHIAIGGRLGHMRYLD